MQGRPTVPQMSVMDPTKPLWCERMQDMSGFALPASTSPPLDEQFDFSYITAQNENDFDVHISENPSPGENNMWGDQSEVVLGEDSNLFDSPYPDYNVLDNKINEWLPSEVEINEFAKSSTIVKSEDILPSFDLENSLIFSGIPKVSNKPSADSVPFTFYNLKEPDIKEEPNLLTFTEDKSFVHLSDEMEVAEEVVVSTETHSGIKSEFFGTFSFVPTIFPDKLKEKVIVGLPECETSETNDLDMDIQGVLLDSLKPANIPCPRLFLDLEAAMTQSPGQQFTGLPDTPEVLKPVLKPAEEFDIISFILANGDSNNNSIMPSVPVTHSTESLVQRIHGEKQETNQLLLSVPEDCQKWESSTQPSHEPTAGPSVLLTPSGRPARKSATKFIKLLEDGLLNSTMDSQSLSSDDEDILLKPKSKRRRTTSSSSSRKRLNSDSDQSNLSESPAKYRERRDRNNLSSKRSRQKRKVHLELKQVELKELEDENKRLKRKADKMEELLNRVKEAWKEYLDKIKRENKER